jgi:hypothetical protein
LPAQVEEAVPDSSLELMLRGLNVSDHQRGRPLSVAVGDRLGDGDVLLAGFSQ